LENSLRTFYEVRIFWHGIVNGQLLYLSRPSSANS